MLIFLAFVETGHEWEWFEPNYEKLWRYNRHLQQDLGRPGEEFSAHWSTAGASLRGRRRFVAIMELILPEITGIVQFSWETPSFQQMVKHQFTEGTLPVPPEPPPALCDCVVVPSLALSLQGGCHSGGGRGITFCSPKRALRKIFSGFVTELIFCFPWCGRIYPGAGPGRGTGQFRTHTTHPQILADWTTICSQYRE